MVYGKVHTPGVLAHLQVRRIPHTIRSSFRLTILVRHVKVTVTILTGTIAITKVLYFHHYVATAVTASATYDTTTHDTTTTSSHSLWTGLPAQCHRLWLHIPPQPRNQKTKTFTNE